MPSSSQLEHSILRALLDKELEAFRLTLEAEDPGLSDTEIERFMRAAQMFAAQLTGARPRTRVRQPRKRTSQSKTR